MFFKRQKKSAEQIENEKRLMWVHENASYMTYVDDVMFTEGELEIEGPHSIGRISDQKEVLALDCNGKPIGKVLIKEFDSNRQKNRQVSIYTGEYVTLSAEWIQGETDDISKISMLVNEDLFDDHPDMEKI